MIKATDRFGCSVSRLFYENRMADRRIPETSGVGLTAIEIKVLIAPN